MSNSLRLYGLWITRLLYPCLWDSPGKNTAVGCHTLPQGNLPNPGIKPRFLAWQVGSLPLNHQGKPKILYPFMGSQGDMTEGLNWTELTLFICFYIRMHLKIIYPVINLLPLL